MDILSKGLAALALLVFFSASASGNTRPSISNIPNQSIAKDGKKGPIGFTVSDAETSAGQLKLSKSTSNSSLLPTSGISFVGGVGANRVVTLTPTKGRTGSATVSITVRDPQGLTATDTFTVTVYQPNTRPWISAIPNQTMNQDTVRGPISFTVGDAQTSAGSLTLSKSSSNRTLLPESRISFVGGSGANRVVTLSPVAGQTGTANVTVTIRDSGNLTASTTFRVTVNEVNTPPTITQINDQTLDMGTSVGPIPFTVGDNQTSAGSLTLSKTSSNEQLLPLSGISFVGGVGANRVVTLTPTPGEFGVANVTVTVRDGGNLTASTSFRVTVNEVNTRPTITHIGDQTINMDSSVGPISFEVSDAQTSAGSLTLSKSSTNEDLLPLSGISFVGGSGADRMVTLTPAPGEFGTANVTIVVSDGELTDSQTFSVDVINTEPTITQINDQTLDMGTSVGPISFTVGDGETPAGDLTLSKISTNEQLLPLSGISFVGGAGANRVVTLTPTPGEFGQANVTIIISDNGNLTASTTFSVTVNESVNNTPPFISSIADTKFNINTTSGAIAFTVGDAQTQVSGLTLTASSSNPQVLTTPGISFDVIANKDKDKYELGREVVLSPLFDTHGEVEVTITVTDEGGLEATESFNVLVNALPEMTDLVSQTLNKNAQAGPLEFTVSDFEDEPAELTLSKVTNNSDLLPLENISFVGGQGENRQVTLTPVLGTCGKAEVTVIVNDTDGGKVRDTIELTVLDSQNNLPQIHQIDHDRISFPDQTMKIPFSVSDTETPADQLSISVFSDNNAVLDASSIQLTGSGEQRFMEFTLNSDTGAVNITIQVDDGTCSVAKTFSLKKPGLTTQDKSLGVNYVSFIENVDGKTNSWQYTSHHEITEVCGALDADGKLANGKKASCRKTHNKFYDGNFVEGRIDTYEFTLNVPQYDLGTKPAHIIIFQDWVNFDPNFNAPHPITTLKLYTNENDEIKLGLFENSWEFKLCDEGEVYPADSYPLGEYPYCWNGQPHHDCHLESPYAGPGECDSNGVVTIDHYLRAEDGTESVIFEENLHFHPDNREVSPELATTIVQEEDYAVTLIIKHGNYDASSGTTINSGVELKVGDQTISASYQTKDVNGVVASHVIQWGQYLSQEYNAYMYHDTCNGSWCGNNIIQMKDFTIKTQVPESN